MLESRDSNRFRARRFTIKWDVERRCNMFNVFLFLLCCWELFHAANGFYMKYCSVDARLNATTNLHIFCENHQIKSIPNDIPLNTKSLDLTMNYISKIKLGDLKNLTLLRVLNMSRNRLSQVESGAFVGVTMLKELNLDHNSFTSISGEIFLGLHNLTVLRLGNNNISSITSSLSCVQLPNLRELFLGANRIFSFHSENIYGFSKSLVMLDLNRNPLRSFNVTGDTLPHLQSLSVSFCGTTKRHLKWDVVRPFLKKVTSLDLSSVQMSLKDISRVLQSLNSSLKDVTLSKMNVNIKALLDIVCRIPTLRGLQVQSNSIAVLHYRDILHCTNLTELDLGYNQLTNLSDNSFEPLQCLQRLVLKRNRFTVVPTALKQVPTLRTLDLSMNIIKDLNCLDFDNLRNLTTLLLDWNKITSLRACHFKGLGNLKTLSVSNNHIIEVNNAFSAASGLANLERLDLSKNNLVVLRKATFRGVGSMKTLSLHSNKGFDMDARAFEGLDYLETLLLDSCWLTIGKIARSQFKALSHLKHLDLSSNNFMYRVNQTISPPFYSLASLESLHLNQQINGMFYMPPNFLAGLSSVSIIKAGNLNIMSFELETFTHTPKLKELDISKNPIKTLSPLLFLPVPGLQRLFLSKGKLQSLDFLIRANLTQLAYLQVRENELVTVNQTVLQSLPSLTFLDMRNNTLVCDCSNAWLVQWVKNDMQTLVVEAYNLVCQSPLKMKDSRLLNLDVHSCTLGLNYYFFLSTLSVVLLLQAASFAYHLLKWQAVYAYYLFLAYLFDTRKRNQAMHNQYDAFVSYNIHDEPWVITQLLPKLEGEQGWKLCLHHRDFQPGKPILENIEDAVYGSRKTLCVITRHYLESEWCSREIQVASFRLFDEKKDVLILVFLEEIPLRLLSPYHRMRGLLKRRTYLSWPRAGLQHRGLFWEKLRLALQSRGDSDGDNPLLTGVERP